MRKTTDIHVSQTKNTRLAGSEIPAKCLPMFCHSDILIEKQKCRDLKNIAMQLLEGTVLRIFFGQVFLNISG